MPPIDFEEMASDAFEEIKCAVGIEATYFPKVGAPVDIVGIFDDRAQEVDPDTQIRVSSNVYTFGIKLSDLDFTPLKGDKIQIKDINYLVINALEDGVPDVSTVLVLHRETGAQ